MQPPIRQLWALYNHLADLESGLRLLSQTPRRERGAYRHPKLSPLLVDLEATLTHSFHGLFTDLLDSLKGRSDDIIKGRLHQAKRPHGSVAEAADYFDIPEDEVDQPVDRSRLAALLALLLLWKQRHTALLKDAAQKAFDAGRAKAIDAAKLPEHEAGGAVDIPPAFLARYESDVERLAAELENGTKRSAGVRAIIENSATLGDVALGLRELENVERFRVEMLSEHMLWWAESAGTIAGAKESTALQLALLGYGSVKDLPAELLEKVPRYVWAGPDDERCCPPCLDGFGEGPVTADEMIPPYERCDFGINCRHSYEPFGE